METAVETSEPVTTQPDYTHHVSQLLTVGDCRIKRDWPDYVGLYGFTENDIPELIRLATDQVLHSSDSDSPDIWAPIHAWRVLGQLKASAAVEPLVKLFHEVDNDWVATELPEVFAMIGTSAIPALADYLHTSEETYPRAYTTDALEEIGKAFPEAKASCIEPIMRLFARYQQNEADLNGFLLSTLITLKAEEALPIIEQAFKEDCIDPFIAGDWEDVQIEFGLLSERITKRPRFSFFGRSFTDTAEFSSNDSERNYKTTNHSSKNGNKKAKAKRKAAKFSRRKNRQR